VLRGGAAGGPIWSVANTVGAGHAAVAQERIHRSMIAFIRGAGMPVFTVRRVRLRDGAEGGGA